MGFLKKSELFQIVKGSKFAVECDWNSKISQSIQNLGSFKVNRWASWKKSEFFQIAEGSKFAVECDWNSRISQSIQSLGFFKQNRWLFWKKLWICSKFAKVSKLAVECDWISKNSQNQNVQNLFFFPKRNRWGFPK